MVDLNKLREYLVLAAHAGKTVTYSEIAQLLRLSSDDPEDRMLISRNLDEISCSENARGRPLLSAVVVLPEIGYPAKGFFLLARELGLNLYCDERSFYSHELQRVHDYWSKRMVDFPTAIPIRPPSYSDRIPEAVH